MSIVIVKKILSILVISLLMLEACGQSGALYLPPPTEVNAFTNAPTKTFEKDEADGETANSLVATTLSDPARND
jgi:predicted small lipoprotein YifL